MSWLDSDAWPFEPLCAELRCSLFHPKWERRHGAAAGLRALLRRHGLSAGSVGGVRECVSAELRAQWLEDCAIRLLSVLALDRFGDWAAGDRVTAPVRETAAQALAVTVRAMDGAAAVARALLTMATEAVWEVRHGALLALKYTLASRPDLLPSLLPLCAPLLIDALQDEDDDVRGAAASALLGVAPHLESTVPLLLPRLLGAVWAALVRLDDLTASTGSVMSLGARLSRELPYTQLCAALPGDADATEAVRPWEGIGHESHQRGAALFLRVLPRLWPFMRHPAADTRCAAITTLHTLVSAAADASADAPPWLPPLLPTALRLLLQSSFLDHSEKVHAAATEAWQALLRHAPLPELRTAAAAHRAGWLTLASTSPGCSPDASLLLCPSYEGGHDDAAAAKAAEAAVSSSEAQARVAAALGGLAYVCGGEGGWAASLRETLASASAARRQLGAWTVAEWAAYARRGERGGAGGGGVKLEVSGGRAEGGGTEEASCFSLYEDACLCLSTAEACCEVAPELAPYLAVLRAEATNLGTAFERAGLPRSTMADSWPRGGLLSLRGAETVLGSLAPAWEAALRVPANAASRIRCRESRDMLAGAAAAVRRAQSELLIQARRTPSLQGRPAPCFPRCPCAAGVARTPVPPTIEFSLGFAERPGGSVLAKGASPIASL